MTRATVDNPCDSDRELQALFAGTSYRPEARLGAGGMGELVVVEHREIGRTFVAKLLQRSLAADPVLLDRLRLEAQALGALDHPNIVSVVGIDQTSDGRPFY